MKISMQGQDYSDALDPTHELIIRRRLNEPTTCQLSLSLPMGTRLPVPMRNQSLEATGDDGTIYFTGYLSEDPIRAYAGVGVDGPRCTLAIQAVSDDLLMDQLPTASPQGAAQRQAGEFMAASLLHSRAGVLNSDGLSLDVPVSDFNSRPGAPWSEIAGQIASLARGAYRATSGTVSLSQIPTMMHALDEADGTLMVQSLSPGVGRGFANDITVCGEREPVAFATEYFIGDGTNGQFRLSADPYFSSNSQSRIIRELFDEPAVNLTAWILSGGQGYLSVGAGGLAMNGGNGVDGQTHLTWIDPIEIGGTMLLETAGVKLSAGSSGIIGGLLSGVQTASGCMAGFQAFSAPGSGKTSLQPIVGGSAAGEAYDIDPGNSYTLRIRLHCSEIERNLAIYRSFGDQGAISMGGQAVAAGAELLFEIQEFVNGVAGLPVVLYDGSIADVPVSCSVVAASSVNLVGSIRALTLSRMGSAWITSAAAGSQPRTRRIGSVNEAGECFVDSSGEVVFYSGYIPLAGERIAVRYRTVGRAIGRAVNRVSQETLLSDGLPAVVQWIGSVSSPPARSSADCRNAAAALVEGACSVSAGWNGRYLSTRLNFADDVWPGDALSIRSPSMNMNGQVIVREVTLSYRCSCPDLLTYNISFANDWANEIAIKTANSVPADAWYPANITSEFVQDLRGLAVVEINGSSMTINTGLAAPPGGGFEVRRRDFCFMAGDDTDLVMRGSQSNNDLFARVAE